MVAARGGAYPPRAAAFSCPNQTKTNMMNDEVLWGPEEFGLFIGRSRRWVYSRLGRPPEMKGSLPHIRLPGGAPRFIPAVARAWVGQGCPPAAHVTSMQG